MQLFTEEINVDIINNYLQIFTFQRQGKTKVVKQALVLNLLKLNAVVVTFFDVK